MATRSPTVPHAYWGAFATTADLPNVAGSPTQKNTLEAGDQAYVPGALYVCTDATLGAAVWAAAGGGGGVAPMTGARGFTSLNFAETAVAACPGSAGTGFEVTVVAVVENLRNVTNILLSAWDTLFNGPGYQLEMTTARPNMKLASTSGAVLEQFVGNRWIDDSQSYVLVVMSGGYNVATNSRFLRLNDIELYNSSLGGGFTYSPSSLVALRMGASATAGAPSPAGNCIIVGAAYKGDGVLTDAQRAEVIRHVTVEGDLPDSAYTSRWSFAGSPTGLGFVGPVVDQIGASDMTVTGSLEIAEVRPAGRPTLGASLTVVSTTEYGFMSPTEFDRLTHLFNTRTIALQGTLGDGATTGLGPAVIGAIYLELNTVIGASSRAYLGAPLGGTATLQFRRVGTGVLVPGLTWSVAGALADVALAGNVTMAASDWYAIELAGDAITTISAAYGIRLNYF